MVASADIVEDSPIPAGMRKQDFMDIKFNNALIEEDEYDMLVMGRTQGKGCYCFVNGLLQTELRRLSGGYKYIVVDNEAGMEHISRGILPDVDIILLVSDCSRRGVQAVGRIAELIKEMDMKPSQVKLIINRAPSQELAVGILEEIKLQNLDLIGVVPQDEMVYEFDSEGTPTVKLPEDSKARKALNEIACKLFN